jgi:hypothetical protein
MYAGMQHLAKRLKVAFKLIGVKACNGDLIAHFWGLIR